MSAGGSREAVVTRTASCSCGQLRLTCEGEPVRISMCHCLACQRRTGSVFGVQARFRRDQIAAIEGQSTEYVRIAESGNRVKFRFCPACGSTVYWEGGAFPGLVAVAVGAFAEPAFPSPRHSVFEASRHSWAQSPPGEAVEHLD
jgi:hypothetical protein